MTSQSTDPKTNEPQERYRINGRYAKQPVEPQPPADENNDESDIETLFERDPTEEQPADQEQTPTPPQEPVIMPNTTDITVTEDDKLPLFNPKVAKFASKNGKNSTAKQAKIDKFDGNNKNYGTWSYAMDLRFVKYPENFDTPESRIAEIAEHCTSRAANWMKSIITGDRDELVDDYVKFVEAFKKTFQDAQYISTMQAQYLQKHVKGPVSAFAASFEEAAHACGYPSHNMAPQFLSHMKDEVKKALNRTPTLDREDYEMVRKLAVEVDNNIWQEEKIKFPPRNTKASAVTTRSLYQQTRTNTKTTGTGTGTGKREPLTDQEKERRRREHLCLYCGAGDHIVANCPLCQGRERKLNNIDHGPDEAPPSIKDESVRAPYTPLLRSWRHTDPPPRTKKRPQLIVKGSVGGKDVKALVDSGAEANFIDKEIVPTLDVKKSTPLNEPIVAADGHIIVPKEEATLIELDCDFGELGKDRLEFVPAPLKHQSTILGYPWLEGLNPHIDWKTGGVFPHRKRPRKEPKIQTHARIFLTASVIAGKRHSTRLLSNSKAQGMADRRAVQEDRQNAKNERKVAKALYKRIHGISTHVRNFIRLNLSKISPDDKNTEEENKTSQLDWQQPWHALELNQLLKDQEISVEQALPDHYKDWEEVFSKPKSEELAPTRPGLDHKIEFKPNAKHRRGRIYNMTAAELRLLKTYIEDGLRRGWIRKSKAPHASPVMFKTKPNSTALRLCADYRDTNANTIKNAYPLPLFDDFLPRMHGAKYFTKLDLRNAFHLLRIAEGDEWKTAFMTQFGLYEYQVMPFGLCNAPASFQAWMDDIFKDLQDTMMCYLDDIIIWGDTKEQVIERVKNVLTILRNNSLYARIDKCEFEVTTTKFLGYIIQQNSITIDASRIALVTEWPEPRTLKQVQSFLGFVNFYRRFIPRFSHLAHGLTALTRKDKVQRRFELSEVGLQSFHDLQEAFKGTKILHIWDPSLPAILETDASAFAIAGILSQIVNGVKIPIGFYSKKHSPEESRYGTPDQELMAICYSLQHWRHYLEGAQHQITVYSDHANLQTFNTTANLNRRQAGYWAQMSRFDYVVKHIPGKNNPADLPSRREDYKLTAHDVPEIHPFLRLAAMSQVPPEVYNALVTATATDDFATEVDPLDEESNLKWKNDILIYADERVYVPPSLRNRILELCHDFPLAGHQGQARTYEKCSRDWYWPYMKHDVERYVRGCRNCNENKDTHHAAYGKLSPLPIPESRWSRVHMDFITDLPKTTKGNNAILVVIDALTKMAHFIPVKLKGNESVNAREAAELFRRECIRLHGIPGTIVSDRDTRFLNKFWKNITKKLGIIQQPTTAYHSTANGQVERINTIIEALLRAYCNEAQTDWDTWLDTCEFAYNDSKTSATGTTPFFANYGFHPKTQSHPEARNNDPDAHNDGTDWAAKQQIILDKCKGYLEKTRANMAKYYDQRHSEMDFKVGDQVMLKTRNLPLEGDKSRKLAARWIGPFPIESISGPLTYRLKIPTSFNIKHPVYHVSNLEKHHKADVAQGQAVANEPRAWREKITSPIQNSLTPYKILASRTSQGGKQTHYKLEFTNTRHIVWAPKTFVGFAHSDDHIVDNFHTANPEAPRPAGYILEAERVWQDIDLPAKEDYTRRRGRPKVQFTRESNYSILAERPHGDKDLEYQVCNTERPTVTRWMTRTQLIKVIGYEGTHLVKDYNRKKGRRDERHIHFAVPEST